MSKKEDFGTLTPAEMLLKGMKTKAATPAAETASVSVDAGQTPASAPGANAHKPISAKVQTHKDADTQKIKLNIAFNSNNYEYLKLIALLDKTNITAYINKLVETDLEQRKPELQRIKDIIA